MNSQPMWKKYPETDFIKSMKNNKIPGKGFLTKKVYAISWDEPKNTLLESGNQAFHTKTLLYFSKKSCDQVYWQKKNTHTHTRLISLLNGNTRTFQAN